MVSPLFSMDLSSVNHLAILTAAIVSFIIGFLWHGPVFGKVWLQLMNISAQELEAGKKEMGKKMPYVMLAALVQQFITAAVMGLLIQALGITSFVGAVTLAFWIWLGFVATVLLNGVLWEKRSINLYLFNIAYHFVILAAMAKVLVWMG